MQLVNKTRPTGHRQYMFWQMVMLFLALLVIFLPAPKAYATTGKQFVRQDLSVLKHKIEAFLMTQTAGYTGNIAVKSGAIDPNLKLADCVEPEVFMPPRSRAWGKTTVGVRCHAPARWTIYVRATVSIKAQYLVAAQPMAQGHAITVHDIAFAEGDLTQLPAGVYTDVNQVVGHVVRSPLLAGSVIRQNMLKQALAVQQGQTVLLTTSGVGFSISAEGKAMKNANTGQVVPVKVQSGQVVSGIARADGKVEVSF